VPYISAVSKSTSASTRISGSGVSLIIDTEGYPATANHEPCKRHLLRFTFAPRIADCTDKRL